MYLTLLEVAMLKEAAALKLLEESEELYKLAAASELWKKSLEALKRFRGSRYFWPTVTGVGGLAAGGLGGYLLGRRRSNVYVVG